MNRRARYGEQVVAGQTIRVEVRTETYLPGPQSPSLGARFAVWSCTDGATMLLGTLGLLLRTLWNVTLAGGRAARGLGRFVVVIARDEASRPLVRTVLPQFAIMLGLVLAVIALVCLVTYAATGHL